MISQSNHLLDKFISIKMARSIVIILFVILFAACEKHKTERQPGYGLEFYLIRDFQKVGTGFKIDNSTVKLSETVIIYFDEIISYDADEYTFTVIPGCADRLNDYENNQIHGMPFAVAVDRQIIYTGYFWCGFSSTSVDWVTVDPLNYAGKNKLQVSLGYPGIYRGDYIPDNRNDGLILNIMGRTGKLVR